MKEKLHTFKSTKDTYKENRKAEIKNYNLPILREMYMGDPNKELRCMMTGRIGFAEFKSFVSNKFHQRFLLDFDHIRQKRIPGFTGVSVDKSKTYPPSGLFRGFKLDAHPMALIEFMTCWPILTEVHESKTQDSTYGDIVLSDIPKEHWPWVLKTKENYDYFTKKYGIDYYFTYDEFIEFLSDINNISITEYIANGKTTAEENRQKEISYA